MCPAHMHIVLLAQLESALDLVNHAAFLLGSFWRRLNKGPCVLYISTR